MPNESPDTKDGTPSSWTPSQPGNAKETDWSGLPTNCTPPPGTPEQVFESVPSGGLPSTLDEGHMNDPAKFLGPPNKSPRQLLPDPSQPITPPVIGQPKT
jgi:hypothetical protein